MKCPNDQCHYFSNVNSDCCYTCGANDGKIIKEQLRSKVIKFIRERRTDKQTDLYIIDIEDFIDLNSLFDEDNHHITESAPHFHNWEDGTYYSHSHKGGNVPHGHHGCRYGMPELPKLTKDSLEIKRDGVFDD